MDAVLVPCKDEIRCPQHNTIRSTFILHRFSDAANVHKQLFRIHIEPKGIRHCRHTSSRNLFLRQILKIKTASFYPKICFKLAQILQIGFQPLYSEPTFRSNLFITCQYQCFWNVFIWRICGEFKRYNIKLVYLNNY